MNQPTEDIQLSPWEIRLHHIEKEVLEMGPLPSPVAHEATSVVTILNMIAKVLACSASGQPPRYALGETEA